MKAAFVVTWSSPVPGRERKAIEYFREVNEFYGKLAAEGKCTEPEWFLAPHGHNIWFVKGEYEMFVSLLATPEVQRFIMEGDYLNRDFDYDIDLIGTEDYIKTFEEVGVKLGYV